MAINPIKKFIDSKHLVVDIDNYHDLNEIINLFINRNIKVFVLNDLITARLHYYDVVLIRRSYFESIELYMFLFDKKMNESDKKIYNSMRTFKPEQIF